MKQCIKWIILSMGSSLIVGCAAVPPLNFSTPNVGVATKKINAEVKSMTVTVARPEEQIGRLVYLAYGYENIVPPLWQTSLIEALNKMAIFQDDAPTKVNILVKILKFDVPIGGSSYTTDVTARYEIIDRKNGDVIYTQDVSSMGVTTSTEAMVPLGRAIESFNRAVQNNITQFLQSLETLNIQKPMFPANPKVK